MLPDLKWSNWISFIVSIPLSNAMKERLDMLVRKEKNSVVAIKSELEDFLSKQEAFEAMCQQAITRIKKKGLSADEEQRQIEDLTDYAAQMKLKFGM